LDVQDDAVVPDPQSVIGRVDELLHETVRVFSELADLVEDSASSEAVVTLHRAFIESTHLTHVFETQRTLRRVQVVQQGIPTPGVQEVTLREGWVEYKEP
jgi:hypothetical protein